MQDDRDPREIPEDYEERMKVRTARGQTRILFRNLARIALHHAKRVPGAQAGANAVVTAASAVKSGALSVRQSVFPSGLEIYSGVPPAVVIDPEERGRLGKLADSLKEMRFPGSVQAPPEDPNPYRILAKPKRTEAEAKKDDATLVSAAPLLPAYTASQSAASLSASASSSSSSSSSSCSSAPDVLVTSASSSRASGRLTPVRYRDDL